MEDRILTSFNDLQDVISANRLEKYLNVVGGDQNQAILLYDYQVAFCNLFAGVTHYFEIILRNRIDAYMAMHYDPDWLLILSASDGMFNQQNTIYTHHELTRTRCLLEKRNCLSNAKMLDELMFGFWVGLFQTKQYRLLDVNLLSIFNLPESPQTLNKIHWSIDQVRKIRNKIAHHSAIIFDKNGDINFGDVEKCICNIQNLTESLGVSVNIYSLQLENLANQRKLIENLLANEK